MKFNIAKYLTIVAAGVMLTACSNDDDFTPGPATSPDSPEVYFSDATQAQYLLSTGEAHTVEINLGRVVTEEELTVPIIANYVADGLTVPSEATFAAGEATTSITINVTDDYKLSTPYAFELALPDELVNYYSTTLPGTASISSKIVIVKPLVCSCYFYYYYSKLGKRFNMDMMIIGDNKYYFPDFMGCGYPVTINVDPSTNDITMNCEVGTYYEDYSDFYIDAPLYPGGDTAETYITDAYFYYPGYSVYFDDSSGRGLALNVYMYMADGSSDYDWCYIYFPTDNGEAEAE